MDACHYLEILLGGANEKKAPPTEPFLRKLSSLFSLARSRSLDFVLCSLLRCRDQPTTKHQLPKQILSFSDSLHVYPPSVLSFARSLDLALLFKRFWWAIKYYGLPPLEHDSNFRTAPGIERNDTICCFPLVKTHSTHNSSKLQRLSSSFSMFLFLLLFYAIN